jgi:DNA-binding CsgD family transcriptional regulator
MLWVVAGKSNGDIGSIPECSGRTVKKHLWHIFRKLGVETRTAAAVEYLRRLAEAARATAQDPGAA